MVERFRTQLFMMLVQQSGVGSLPLSTLTPEQFLEFIRKVESKSMSEGLAPVIAYWSSHSAKRLMPDPAAASYRQLMREAFCVSVFSEERTDKDDEFCFLIESSGLCMAMYGRVGEDCKDGKSFQCVGTVDPYLTKRAFNEMLLVWQFIDLSESNRLEDARLNVGNPGSLPTLVKYCRDEWPVVKVRSGTNKIVNLTIQSNAAVATGQPNTHELPRPIIGPNSKLVPESGRSRNGQGGSNGGDGADSSVAGAPPPATAFDTKEPLPAHLEDTQPLGEDLAKGKAKGAGVGKDPPGAATPPSSESIKSAGKPQPRAGRDTRSLNLPQEAWISIPGESTRTTFPPDAQRIIREMISQLRHSSDLPSILQYAIEQLTNVCQADRGLIWQVLGDQLTVTNEFAPNGNEPFGGQNLSAQESTAIVLEFLQRFPDESNPGVIAIPDTMKDTKLHKMSQGLSSLIELGAVKARLIVQLRCRGVFSGFLELQQCESNRQWTDQDAATLQAVAEVTSFVVQQAFDMRRMEVDAKEKELINTISGLFRESRGQRMKDSLVKSVRLVADHMGFQNSQIYLIDDERTVLRAQMEGTELPDVIGLIDHQNPFVSVYESGRSKVINAEPTHKRDPVFVDQAALIVPLQSEGERLGVMGLWKRVVNKPQFRAPDRELAITIAGNLAGIVRADQAIAQIRAERARQNIIIRVANKIKENPKELDPILRELADCLQEYLGLALCSVSLFDKATLQFGRSVLSGPFAAPAGDIGAEFCEDLLQPNVEPLKQGQTLIADLNDIKPILDPLGITVPPTIKCLVFQPFLVGKELKGALCMVSTDHEGPYPTPDMHMINDMALRVAIEIERKELFETVERQAVTDPMTGLFNRRYFQEQLAKEMDRHQRFGHAFSYIILDLDFLKRINDQTEGQHLTGDAAIRHIAYVLKRCVRDVDTIARYGGEEFVVLLPETDVAGARIVAERMCQAIPQLLLNKLEKMPERDPGTKPTLEDLDIYRLKDLVARFGPTTASFGVATFPYDAQDRETLSELADKALFLAKHRGRNQVCSVSEDLRPALAERGEEALEVEQARIQARADELASIDLKLVAEHGLLGILGTIIKLIEARDAYTAERSPRAADLAAKLSQALHLSREHSTIISLAAILHNIGKIAVDQEILQKKGDLTDEEWKIIQSTPMLGAKILEPAKHLHRVAAVVESYHEHWDGSGYPKGMTGEDIPLESRIIALVDAFVAMTSDRPYRKAMTAKEAIKILKEGSGHDWDPRLVKLFIAVLNKEYPDA